MGADDAGEVLLAAEGAAGLGLDDAALFLGQAEDQRERVDEVVGALHGAGDGDRFQRAVGRAEGFGDDAVVFDVELLLRAGAVLAFDDEVGGGEGGLELGGRAVLHEEGLEGVRLVMVRVIAVPDDSGLVAGGARFGVFDGEDAGKFLVGDVDGLDGGGQDGLVGVREKQDGFGWVVDGSAARQGWSLARWTMVFSPGMSAAVTMVNWDQSMRGRKVMEVMRPRAMVERTVAPYHMPGRVMSSTYWARPVTLARPSLRMGDVPTMGPGSGIGVRRSRVSNKDRAKRRAWE